MVAFQQLSKDDIYDQQIAPLLDKVREICVANEMSFFLMIHTPSHTSSSKAAFNFRVTEEWDPPDFMVAVAIAASFQVE